MAIHHLIESEVVLMAIHQIIAQGLILDNDAEIYLDEGLTQNVLSILPAVPGMRRPAAYFVDVFDHAAFKDVPCDQAATGDSVTRHLVPAGRYLPILRTP